MATRVEYGAAMTEIPYGRVSCFSRVKMQRGYVKKPPNFDAIPDPAVHPPSDSPPTETLIKSPEEHPEQDWRTAMTAASFGHLVTAVMCLATAEAGAKETSVEDALRQWAEVLRSSKVAEMVILYEDSEHVVALESSGKVRQGAAAVRKMYQEAFDEVVFKRTTFDALKVRESGDVAWATCRFKADTVVRADQSRWTLQIQGSFVLKREKGAWKIVLEHFSPIGGVPRVQRR